MKCIHGVKLDECCAQCAGLSLRAYQFGRSNHPKSKARLAFEERFPGSIYENDRVRWNAFLAGYQAHEVEVGEMQNRRDSGLS